jgi:NADPH:quinone reductase
MRAVQITRFGGPEVFEVVEPEAGPGQKLYDVSTAGVNTPTPTTASRAT